MFSRINDFGHHRVMLETAHDNGKKAFFSVGDGGV